MPNIQRCPSNIEIESVPLPIGQSVPPVLAADQHPLGVKLFHELLTQLFPEGHTSLVGTVIHPYGFMGHAPLADAEEVHQSPLVGVAESTAEGGRGEALLLTKGGNELIPDAEFGLSP
jgi:hypothetical protein